MKSKASLDDLALFYSIAQHSSLSAAASSNGIPMATMSRRLQNLERTLGCRLLERTAHRFAVTEAGQAYLAACGPLLEELEVVAENLNESRQGLCGSLRVTAPVNLSHGWLGDCFFDFMKTYPGIRLQIQVTNYNENLVEQQLDAAIRVGEIQDSTQWIARPISQTRFVLCASRHYLASAPPLDHPGDLLQHKLIVVDPVNHWKLTHESDAERFALHPQAYFRTTDIQLAMDAAVSGFGVTLVPDYYLSSFNETDSPVVRVLPNWRGPSRPICLR
jgi:DNA-binding transcriptional LysR family regulator